MFTLLYPQTLIIGDMLPNRIENFSTLVDEVFYPILGNPANQDGWPEEIKRDIDLHIQELRNVIAEVSRKMFMEVKRLELLRLRVKLALECWIDKTIHCTF